MDRVKRSTRRVAIGTVGGVVLVIGIVAIPYPGPGWLIVFTGLAILSTEFEWAHRLLHFGRAKYEAWEQWLRVQSPLVRGLVLAFTGLVVVLTMWLLNVFGMTANLLQLHYPWLYSPLPFF